VAEGAVPLPTSSPPDARHGTLHRVVVAERDLISLVPAPAPFGKPNPLSHVTAPRTNHELSSPGSHCGTTVLPVNCHGNQKQTTNAKLVSLSC